MFSRWDFARSAEAIFSRWAVKRVCKFLLKKKLGDFILGDIDLDQLDVQTSQGTIHLSDLALNVDLLNQKLAGSSVMVKEGSVASLSIKIPWKLQNCQIEVEELELVLAPFVEDSSSSCCGGGGGGNSTVDSPKGMDRERVDLGGAVPESLGSGCLDIHEGVKTIAKIVKWFLTSFHVRLRNLIIAFDPCLDGDGKKLDCGRSLVLRIAEIEYGTCVSEDAGAVSNSNMDSLLGKAKLTNFVKFHGAVVEFLKMDDVDSGMSFSEWQTGRLASQSTTTVLSGTSSGFSGRLNLSIPWKNGSLDIRKVDADFSVDPLQFHLQPSTIKWMIVVWESVKNVGASSRSYANGKFVDLSTPSVSTTGVDVLKQGKGSFLKSMYPTSVEDTFPDTLLPRTRVIHNWVPLSINEEVQTELEQDYGASIDQFFECFDGMRSSQAGSSGIWNWTCSVFSAITVASNLASGSVHIPVEQQNVETSLRASIAEVSVTLSFRDEELKGSHDLMGNRNLSSTYGDSHGNLAMSDIISPDFGGQSPDSYMSCFSSMNTEQSTIAEIKPTNPDIHHLEARCHNLLFNLQVCSQKTTFEASVMHFKVDEYHDSTNHAEGFVFPACNKSLDEILILNHNLQREVHGSLPAFPFPPKEQNSEIYGKSIAEKCEDGLVKVVLLESFGICVFHYSISSSLVDGKSMTSTSFSIDFPPLILWIHFQLVNVLLNLFKQVESYFEESNGTEEYTPGSLGKRHGSSFLYDLKSGSPTYITTVSSKASLQGNVVLPHARFILCLPSNNDGNFRNSSSLDKFIVLEHYPSLGTGNDSDPFTFPEKPCSPKGNNFCAPSTSIHFCIGDVDLYLVDRASKLSGQPISAVKILSGVNKSADRQSGITMVWQKGPVTGAWMAGRAWSLASKHDKSRNRVAGKSYEFSSVTSGEDPQETSSHIRQELILSSAFFLHVKFPHVRVNIDGHAYKLLNQIINDISNGAYNAGYTLGEHLENKTSKIADVSQASVLVEFDFLNLCINLNEAVDINPSVQKELEGSWKRVKLRIEKLELLSVSNIGGVRDANFFWLNHGEGELWGSIFDGNDKAEDFLLISCRNSVRRDDGKGSNALSFGAAGMTVLYQWNPQLLQSYTSIIVRCGDIIAPGGRLDWVNAICSLFSSPHETAESTSDGGLDDTRNEGSFFLDLVDVALSYEPHRKCPLVNNGGVGVDYSSEAETNEKKSEQYVAALLAAASLTFSHHTVANYGNETTTYNIQLQDVGLLLCELSCSSSNNGGYYANSLRKNGYVKVGQVALVEAVLRIKALFWEVDCPDTHINLDTCQDSTNGLIRLIAQLQQLYAPDMEDAVAHLQSRWNRVQQAHNESTVNDISYDPNFESLKPYAENKIPADSDECLFGGLLDEILENAFNVKVDTKLSSEHCVLQSQFSDNNKRSTVGDAASLNIPFEESVHGSGAENSVKPSPSKTCSPQIIDSYYLCELLPPSKSSAESCIPNQCKSKFDATVRKDIDCGKGRWYQDSSFKIVENHISKMFDQPENALLISEDKFGFDCSSNDNCRGKGRILLKNTHVKWRMYAGLDWSKPRKESRHSTDLQGRDANKCLELSISGLNVVYCIFPDGEVNVSKLSLRMQEFHLYDISRDAPWKMVLGYYASKHCPRESSAKAFKLDLEVVRPDPLTPIEDYRLQLELLPIRLHLDQGQLNFLISFFGKSSIAENPDPSNDTGGLEMAGRENKTFGSQTIVEEALLPFFQKCDVKPLVVCIDYIPRHVDLAALRRGNYAELLNLVPWKGIELQLKHVCAVGVYGWSSVCETVIGQWLEDISQNQVQKLLKGLAPLRSLFAVSSGTSKLVSLPVKSYKKDQKLLKGMQRGAIAFLKSISLEAVGLGVHLAAGAHEILLQTEYILTSIPPSVSVSERSRVNTTVRSNQPEDAHQGIHQAYESLSEGLGKTASALIGTPLKVYQRGAGAGSALATAVRGAPAAAIAPVAASARAVHYTLLGVRNSLDPEHKKESREKYLGPSQS